MAGAARPFVTGREAISTQFVSAAGAGTGQNARLAHAQVVVRMPLGHKQVVGGVGACFFVYCHN